MEQASVGKVCQCNEMGVHGAPSPARCRFSVHLRASACIWEVPDGQTSGDQTLYFVSSACICLHSADEEGDERGERLFNDGLSSMVYRPSSYFTQPRSIVHKLLEFDKVVKLKNCPGKIIFQATKSSP